MNKNLSWKLVVIVGILLVFLAGIFGIPKDWSGKGILASITDRIHLGLDLRGGTHLILQVQVDDAVNVDSDNAIARLKEDMRARKINYADITKPEPVIQEHGLGQYQILVQLPGVDDPARVKEIMQSTAMLEIKQSLDGPKSYPSQEAALQAHGGVLPPDAVLMQGKSIGSRNTEGGEAWYIISRASAVTGRDLRDAQPGTDENGQPEVKFILTGDGGRKFQAFTSAHVGDSLAVVLDNKVQEVAEIKSAISDNGVITGRFTQQETQDLSMTLRSGALPAGIKYLEERTVGPSLGADSIRSGVRAALVGMLVVLVFMLIYYRW